MRYYKTYNFIAVFSVTALVAFLGAVIFWPQPQSVNAVSVPQTAAPAQTSNKDYRLPAANFAADENISDEVYSQGPDIESLFTQNTSAQMSPIQISPDDSGFKYAFASPADSDSKSAVNNSQSDSSSPSSQGPAPAGAAGGSGSSGTSGSDSSASGGSGSSGATPPSSSGSSVPAGGGGGGNELPAELYKPRNIANIFYVDTQITQNNRLLPLSAAVNNLNQYEAFWYAQRIANLHPQAWATLRSKYPGKLALHYVTPFSVVPNPSDSSKMLYLDYDYIQQYHPEWFLLKDENNASSADYGNPDKRMRWNPNDPADNNYERFFLDVGNSAFQSWAVEELLKKLDPVSGISTRVRYSGIAADNVLLTVWANAKTALYPNWKYAASASRWNQAYFSYLRRLHDALKQRGYLLIANATLDYSSNSDSTDWQNLMAVVDGLMNENALAMSSTSTVWGNDMFGKDAYDFWDYSLLRHEKIVENGLYDWWVFIPHKDDIGSDEELKKFLYIYCSFLLVKDVDRSFFGAVREKNGTHILPWYEEYALPLGGPVGLRYQRNGCWLRDYQHGKVVVNPSAVSCTISLDSQTYTLDWRTKKAVTRVTLEPRTATILLPTGYPVK
jgi:hypothetical protein